MTTAPAPITAPSPTVTPGSMVADAPIQTSLPMRTGLATVLTDLRSSTEKSWLGVAMQTLGPMRV